MSHSYHKTSSQHCPACNFGPFVRNNYFTGKLLVERDFTDETRYHMEKIRHHQQQLHGWGVVCGLKVKQHPNEKCRDRFVCIEPGYAVDCCGRDIVVLEEECIDISALPEIKALKDNNDTNAHTVQICIRYRECPTEEIPVLYDDCGCDDTKCAPNRILESYDIGVILDPPKKQDPFHTPKFEWEAFNSIPVSQATDVALHEASQRVYVLGGAGANELTQWSTNPQGLLAVRPFPHEVLAMAPSQDGTRLYVVVAQASPSSPRQLFVIDTEAPGLPEVSIRTITNSGNSKVRLAVAPDARLYLLVEETGDLFIGPNNLNSSGASTPPSLVKNIVAKVRGLALSKDGTSAFSLGPTDGIQRVTDLNGTPAVTELKFPTVVVNPKALAVVKSTADDMLVVVQDSPPKIHLIKPEGTGSVVRTVSLAHAPVSLVVSPGGHWAYVLEEDAASSFVQPVSIDRMVSGLPSAGNAFQVGDKSQELELNEAGNRLFIPFLGGAPGGVAILDISEGACNEILWRHLDGCPHCDVPDCIVLATLEGYNVNDVILDLPADQNDPSTVVRIDNRTRQLLPSTQVLTDLVKCLLEHGGGGAGTQGQQGLPGKDGEDGEDGEDGDDGAPGEGLEEGLVRIEALSWSHNQPHLGGLSGQPAQPGPESFFVMVQRLNNLPPMPAIVIGFTAEVRVSGTIDGANVFQVLVPTGGPNDPNFNRGILCQCPMRGKTIPVKLKTDAQDRIITNAFGRIDSAQEVLPGNARGVAFLLDMELAGVARDVINGFVPNLSVKLRGDFVIEAGEQGRAIDAEFVRAELPTGDRPKPPAGQPLKNQLGIQGGLFESWFTAKARPN